MVMLAYVHLNSVKEVTPEFVIYTYKDKATGETVEKRIPSNMVLWSTGIAMNPFTRRVCDLLPNQVHKKVCLFSFRRTRLLITSKCRQLRSTAIYE